MKKKYLILGASSGISQSICLDILKKNKVYLCSRNLNSLSRDIKISKNSHLYKLNILKKKDVFELVNLFNLKKIKFDAVIFFQGKLEKPSEIINIDYNKWLKVFEINFLANVYLVKNIFPLLKKNSYSKIIFFSGGGSFNAWEKFSAYSCAKTALVRFCENLAMETKKYKIIVNCIAPGFLRTAIHNDALSNLNNLNKDYRNQLKKNKNSEPNFNKVNKLIKYLLKNKSLLVSGRTISANFDPWADNNFKKKLKKNDNFLMMRRINLN